MKKTLYMITALSLVAAVSTTALAEQTTGTVTKVRGDKITIEVSPDSAGNISVGDGVTIEVSKKAAVAPAAGNDMLTGC